MIILDVRSGKKTIPEVEASLESSEVHGADIRFHGVVRNREDNRLISAIDYSFYEGMAMRELERVGREMRDKYPDHRAMVYHRVGVVPVGEASILIRVQTPHSSPGFAIIEEYLKQIKNSVPIWKKPVFQD